MKVKFVRHGETDLNYQGIDLYYDNQTYKFVPEDYMLTEEDNKDSDKKENDKKDDDKKNEDKDKEEVKETEQKEETKNEQKPQKSTVKVKDIVNVRKAASTDSDQIGQFLPGAELKKLGEEGDWTVIEFQGGKGYVKTEFLE